MLFPNIEKYLISKYSEKIIVGFSGIRYLVSGIRYSILYLSFFLLITFPLLSQEQQKKLMFNGYISNIQSAMFDSIQKNWTTDNLIHNRLNLKWYLDSNLNFNLEIRNRLLYGESLTSGQNNAVSYGQDYGFLDLTRNIIKGNSYVFNVNVDRLNLNYGIGKFKATLGRQRINWSQTMVWNPNDIFNTYSFFDFDYIERPGSDALRLQYYNTEVSSTELAIKVNSENKVTAAAYYKFNFSGYDFQFIGGILNNEDYVLGTGWSGAIKSVSFRGELSYFRSKNNFSKSTGEILASVGADYTFGNSCMLLAEYLYCGTNITDSISFLEFYGAPQTVKNMSFVKHNFIIQVSIPFTPLFNGSLAGMYFPGIKGYYLGPSLSYSLAQNLDASFYLQAFGGEISNQRQRFNLVFLRIRFSF
jgi:hypothetical protein